MSRTRNPHRVAVLDTCKEARAVAAHFPTWQWIRPDGHGHYEVWAEQ